jgi:hypothetical protein
MYVCITLKKTPIIQKIKNKNKNTQITPKKKKKQNKTKNQIISFKQKLAQK